MCLIAIVYINDIYNITGSENNGMNIIISNSSDKPIYEQITSQIKQMIISGDLQPGDQLPSMRMLAKELRISVITTKRAYEDLERDGFIYTIVGKGSFVADKNMEFVREEQLRIVEEHLSKAVEGAKAGGISLEELQDIIRMIYEEE
ncbi:GntR family transcriptional regulator [Herbinix hemicellulosilytica]|uniref:HTH gntR-type domain-containing protein n=2 Tax=Herbinix hemicellulosilytica TaxID=1564487 RepID=A0A0H5SDM2_HERHM|nr:GntR family transcriptional regulator [Herbinix hemicellulosilytica]CRZ33477.1 hypothetical protein HHT355_0265 [Herbinix hemicellulosilytica]